MHTAPPPPTHPAPHTPHKPTAELPASRPVPPPPPTNSPPTPPPPSAGFAFGPALFAVLGFFMGVAWIDTIASEVVGVISLLAGLVGIPSSVMGLTLLAWGNR